MATHATEGAWISSLCLHTEGFPKLLYTTMQSLGIQERPEYEGREYEEDGTQRCEVTIYVAQSKHYPKLAQAWCTTTVGFRFPDTYQAIALKALQHLCTTYAEPLARTPMKFFLPDDKTLPVWTARMEALQAQDSDPTMKNMATYLLALDELYHKQATELEKCISQAQLAEVYARGVYLQYVQAESHAAAARSREADLAEKLMVAKELHAQQLKEAYLVTRPKRRMFAMLGPEPVILEGHPIHPPGRRTNPAVPPTPAPSEASEDEFLIPLTQPPLREEAHACSDTDTVEGPREPSHRPIRLDEVD
jgi:hypothetical protein